MILYIYIYDMTVCVKMSRTSNYLNGCITLNYGVYVNKSLTNNLVEARDIVIVCVL